jgi:hypothetical protein
MVQAVGRPDRLQRGPSGPRALLVLGPGPATDPDGADDHAVAGHRDAAGEDHDAPVVGGVDAVELLGGLRVFREVLGGQVEGPGGESLVDGDVDAAQPGTVHPHVGHEVSAGVDDGDIHGLANFGGALLGGGNDGAGIREIQ